MSKEEIRSIDNRSSFWWWSSFRGGGNPMRLRLHFPRSPRGAHVRLRPAMFVKGVFVSEMRDRIAW
jgi:hypothetical protein